jgi:UDP:flavonoid glycosyltransferase YjiC (YdhE family)
VPHVLFISGAIGLGHATRDLAIARALRALVPDVRVDWLAADAARNVIRDAGETLLPEAARYTSGMGAVEFSADGFVLNLANPRHLLRIGPGLRQMLRFKRDLEANVAAFKEVTHRTAFDLIVGDETFELAYVLARNPALRTALFALIVDFVGMEAMTRNPIERAVVHVANRGWAALLTRVPPVCDLILFVGEEADVPDAPFGFRLPNRRESGRRGVEFIGYICPFEVAAHADRAAVRAKLGYGEEPLVVCSVGGTAVGAVLLELCGGAFPLLRERFPTLRMVLVCGPRISPASLDVPLGVEVRGYVDRLYEHFAASDLAVVQAGGTTTLELTALRRPFLYFPLEEHFEQQVHVGGRLARHGAGLRMSFSETTPSSLATAILANLGQEVSYPPIPTGGAQRAAELLARRLAPRAGGPS